MARSIYDLLMKGQSVLVSGQKSNYRVAKSIAQNVFKAHVEGTSTPVMLKTPGHPVVYEREVNVYEFDCIRQSPYIRSMREVIANGTDECMVFEWMDSDIWTLRLDKRPRDSPLVKTIAHSVLNALTALSDMDGAGPGVHTDVNPNNIMVSEADGPSPIVKLADLGALIPAGKHRTHRLQGFSIRAPEIWMGHVPSPACDVWSVGVSLAHFLATRALFGIVNIDFRGSTVPLETCQAACSIAKIIQLIGPLTRNEDPKFAQEFDLAESLVEEGSIEVGSLEEELAKVGVEPDCSDFIRYLLIPDPERRPTAKQALEHSWLNTVK